MVHWTNTQCILAKNNRLLKKKFPEADAGWDSQSQTHGNPLVAGWLRSSHVFCQVLAIWRSPTNHCTFCFLILDSAEQELQGKCKNSPISLQNRFGWIFVPSLNIWTRLLFDYRLRLNLPIEKLPISSQYTEIGASGYQMLTKQYYDLHVSLGCKGGFN